MIIKLWNCFGRTLVLVHSRALTVCVCSCSEWSVVGQLWAPPHSCSLTNTSEFNCSPQCSIDSLLLLLLQRQLICVCVCARTLFSCIFSAVLCLHIELKIIKSRRRLHRFFFLSVLIIIIHDDVLTNGFRRWHTHTRDYSIIMKLNSMLLCFFFGVLRYDWHIDCGNDDDLITTISSRIDFVEPVLTHFDFVQIILCELNTFIRNWIVANIQRYFRMWTLKAEPKKKSTFCAHMTITSNQIYSASYTNIRM